MDDFINDDKLNSFIQDYNKEQYEYWKDMLKKDSKLFQYAQTLYDPNDEMLYRLKETIKNDLKNIEMYK